MEQKPTPEQLERARRISADIVAKVDCPLRDKYLDGRCDHSYAVRAALTAILQSDQQQAELLAFVADVAKQKLPDELEDPDGDYEGAYKIIVTRARSAFREWQGGNRA